MGAGEAEPLHKKMHKRHGDARDFLVRLGTFSARPAHNRSRFDKYWMAKDKAIQSAAAKRHYEKNKEVMVERAKAFNKTARERVRAFILEYLLEHHCVDCGQANPIVLEFDHRGDKLFEIGAAMQRGYSLEKVRAEIAKCDVRCANCHRVKTYHERGYKHRTPL